MNWTEQAEKKLKEKVTGTHERAMAPVVGEKLLDFCRQDGEFAQAVCQGGSFQDCMSAVKKKVTGGHISDLDAYQEAVKFYFPGAVVRCVMTIDLVGGEEDTAGVIALDLGDFL